MVSAPNPPPPLPHLQLPSVLDKGPVSLPTDRYQVTGRIVHMDQVKETLNKKMKVNFDDSQKKPNGINLEILADTISVEVRFWSSPVLSASECLLS